MNKELTITLLDKTLSVACPPDRADDLLKAAEFLNAQMIKVQKKKPVANLLDIALIAALNISNDLLEYQEQQVIDEQSMAQLSELITQAL